MARESPVPVEVFVHGALCYSISGLCQASSALLGRSANRGLCAQVCRWDVRPEKADREAHPFGFLPDGRVLVVERTGGVRLATSSSTTSAPIGTVPDITSDGERARPSVDRCACGARR